MKSTKTRDVNIKITFINRATETHLQFIYMCANNHKCTLNLAATELKHLTKDTVNKLMNFCLFLWFVPLVFSHNSAFTSSGGVVCGEQGLMGDEHVQEFCGEGEDHDGCTAGHRRQRLEVSEVESHGGKP